MPKPLIVSLAALLGGVFLWFLATNGAVGDRGALSDREFRRLQAKDPERFGAAEAEVDFELLDEARPLDLIEMDLDFPESLSGLDGRRVRIVGFMAPWDSLTDMSRCLLVPSYVGCTFCSPPSLTQVLYIEQAARPNSAYPFIEEPSDVVGTLRLPRPGSDAEGHRQGFVFVLEHAVVRPYDDRDAPERVPGHWQVEDPVAHAQQIADEGLPPISWEQLVEEVASIRELAPLRPVAFEPVSPERFAVLTREALERRIPEPGRADQAAAFALLGMRAREGEWLDALTAVALRQRVAKTDAEGERVRYLAHAPLEDPFVRLELVKEIAEALARQHFEAARRERLEDDDATRALEAVRQGDKQLVAYRYARAGAFSAGSAPPLGLLPDLSRLPAASEALELWYWLPWESGPFFVDSRTGASRPLSLVDPLYERIPGSTVEIFRPRWYDGPELWRRDPVPPDFAEGLLETAPVHTGVLGLGGIVPWLGASYPPDVSKVLAGNWAGDRYALWRLPEGAGEALLLEIRWQDEVSEQRFRDAAPLQPMQFLEGRGGSSPRTWVALAETEAGLERLSQAIMEKRVGE